MPGKRPSTPQQAKPSPGLMLGPNNQLDDSIADYIEIQPVVLPGFPDDARVELDIPLDSYLFKLTLDFKIVPDAPRDWQGYTWELVGAIPLPETTFERYRFALPVFAGYGAPDSAIVVWRRRVYWEEPPGVYFEVRWHPARGETNTMVWPSHVPHATAAQYLANGLKLLRDLERRGRRRRPPSASERDEFRETIVGLIRLAIRKGMEPTEPFIAELLMTQRTNRPLHTPSVAAINRSADSAARTLRNYLRRYGYTWQEMLTMARMAP